MTEKTKKTARAEPLTLSTRCFTWKGETIRMPSEEELDPVFGKPDRVSTPGDTILTWDSLGLHAVLEGRSQLLISLSASLRPGDRTASPFLPESVFAGEIATPWGSLSAATTQDDLIALGFLELDGRWTRANGLVAFYGDCAPELARFEFARRKD